MTTFADIAPTIAKLLRLLASDKPGEVIATVHALRRVLSSAHLDLNDLGSAIEFAVHREVPRISSTTAEDPDVREMVRRCCEYSDLLSVKELAFVYSMAKWSGQPTERQKAWLVALHERCIHAEASDG